MRDKKLNIDKIWIEYHPKIQVYLKQISPEKDNYEDMASEVLLSVFENLDNYNNDYSLSTWIYTIARNRQIDYIRKTKHQLIEYKEELDFHENTPEQELINHYDIIQIRYAITRLKPRITSYNVCYTKLLRAGSVCFGYKS